MVGSPGSGSDDSTRDDLTGISHQEAVVMLSVKLKELRQVSSKCAELEQMLQDKDEEI